MYDPCEIGINIINWYTNKVDIIIFNILFEHTYHYHA